MVNTVFFVASVLMTTSWTLTLDASPMRISVAMAASNLPEKSADSARDPGHPFTTARAAITCTGTGSATGTVGLNVPMSTTG